MSTLDRRTFLARAGLAGAGAAVLAGLPRPAAAQDATLVPFDHGVASGDPMADRVLLWTRVTPPDGRTAPIPVRWRVFTDVDLTDEVAAGTVEAVASRDWCVKVDATGLDSFTYYYYVFEALGTQSITGRTRTAPAAGEADRLRFGVVSCASYQHGFFNAYARLAERNDIDAVLHLGDYLYEYAPGEYGNAEVAGERDHDPALETVTLADYRDRHSQYKRDPDLRRLHQLFPMIATWDDHETTDNSYATGANNHQADGSGNPNEEGVAWEDRLADASQVYEEWMPVRSQDPKSDLYRSLRYGDLADVVVMDTRIEGREEQAEEGRLDQLAAPDRRMISQEQLDFVVGELRGSATRGTAWRVLAQQVMQMQLTVLAPPDLGSSDTPLFVETPDGSINVDAWDGYPAERQRLWDAILGLDGGDEVTDVVVLTGDIHTSWAADLHPDPGNPVTYDSQGLGIPTATRNVGVEFVTPSITSANFEALPAPAVTALATGIPVVNPHIKFVDLTAHGYNLLDITAERVQSDWFAVDTVLEPSDVETPLASWFTDRGTNRVQQGAPLEARDAGPAVPSPEPPTTPAPAPGADGDDGSPAPAPTGPSLPATGGGALLGAAAAIGAAAALRRRTPPTTDA